jgi:hypothetical protein
MRLEPSTKPKVKQMPRNEFERKINRQFDDFARHAVFVHLQPHYRDRQIKAMGASSARIEVKHITGAIASSASRTPSQLTSPAWRIKSEPFNTSRTLGRILP